MEGSGKPETDNADGGEVKKEAEIAVITPEPPAIEFAAISMGHSEISP